MLAALLAILPASAAGFHFLKAEAIGGVGGGADGAAQAEVGVGASIVSDVVAGWITFGDPAADGHLVRAWRIESSFYGPVLGIVPRSFRGLAPPPARDWLFPWTYGSLGGDTAARTLVAAKVAGHYLLDVPGVWAIDPRRAYVGPSAGLGLAGTWWDGWRDETSTVVMTGKITGEGGLAAGVTVRDTWYAQARAVASIDLFGIHQTRLDVAAVTGVFLDRVGLPLGVELRGELDRGNDTVTTLPETHWSARAALYYKLVPPYQTRIEEGIERRRAARTAPPGS
jgi:hypothetical protein